MQVLFFVCVVLFTLAAALCDFRTQKLPNKLTVPAFIIAFLFHVVLGAIAGGWTGAARGMLECLGGFAVGFGILLVLWLIGGGGGGDVKFMGALGAWLGPQLIVVVFVVSVIFVAVGAAGVLAAEFCRRGMQRTKRRYLDAPQKPSKTADAESTARARVKRRLLPYGVPVALATWSVLILTELASWN